MQRLTRKTIQKFKFKNDEPAAAGSSFITDRTSIIHAFNWYNENGEVAKLREAVEAFAEDRYPESSSIIRSLKDNQISMTICAIARMYLGGVVLPPDILWFLEQRVQELLNVVPSENAPVKERINVVVSEFDDILDDFYRSNYTQKPADFYKHLMEMEAGQLNVRQALAQYTAILDELDTYEHLTAKQKKAYVIFLKAIIDDCEKYLSNTRKATKLRKPRKKKFKSADQLAAKVRFKEAEPELKLTSVPPSSIVGSQSVWLYNVKTRKITYLSGDKLSTKGTTVIGFDPDKSFSKVIRKPETLADLLNTPRTKMLKDIQVLKTKATPANGRLSTDVLILRANK